MPKELHIIDVMPFMHAGHVNRYSFFEQLIDVGASYKTQRTPAGGISLILNTVRDIINKGDIVFCCDRNPTIKKDMLPGYKSNRGHKSAIQVETGVAEYILEECGCSIFARAGYEADDLIYTIVKQCHDMYDAIYIYTGDSDMYFLVDNIVSIKPSSTNAKRVTLDNYESVSIKGSNYRYNTITFSKILHGDTSDCIPAVSKELQRKVTAFFSNPDFYPHMGDKELLLYYADMAFPELRPQIELVFPLFVENIPTSFKKPDWNTLCCFGNAMHNRNFKNYTRPDFDIDGYVAEMQSRGLYIEEEN